MTIGDAKGTVGGLPDLKLSPVSQTIFHPFNCNVMEISECENRDWLPKISCAFCSLSP